MKSLFPFICSIVMTTFFLNIAASAQSTHHVVHLAKLVIASSQLETNKALLKEGVETATRLEPGVLTLYAVSVADQPTHFTIL